MKRTDFDAIVVGSGPNGLAAAITLQQKGLSILLLEGKSTIGGGLRTEELTLPGFIHDVCSAIHPLAIASPFFNSLPLQQFGLEFIQPPVAAAHPFDDGTAAILSKSLSETISSLQKDEKNYLNLIQSTVDNWETLLVDLLGPPGIPKNPIAFAKFGMNALQPATNLAKRFTTEAAKGLFAGMAAHSILPLTKLTTSAIGLILMAAGHTCGWGFPKGGSFQIAQALAAYFISIGGKIETNYYVKSLQQLPPARAVLFDISPKQLLQIAGQSFNPLYRWQLSRYRYGMGIFKIDWALAEPIPFTAEACRRAGTVHIGNTLVEITASEQATWSGKHPEKPFVLLAQQSIFDSSRSPEGKQVAWGYCHVPNGSRIDMTGAIEQQVERFAPGFRERILARHTMNTHQMELYNPNYIGGDITGGANDITQLFSRPALRSSPYRTSATQLYICSSSTPPGGGVHGMCGYNAAMRVWKDIFSNKPK